MYMCLAISFLQLIQAHELAMDVRNTTKQRMMKDKNSLVRENVFRVRAHAAPTLVRGQTLGNAF
jgi:hypothetical protein